MVTTADAVVARGRSRAEALMEDSCLVSRAAARVGTNPETGKDVLGPVMQVYVGRCRVQLPGSQEDVRPAGDRRWTLQRLTLSVPMAVAGIQVGDVVNVTSAAVDPDLAGRRYRVVQVFAKTHATARRLSCEEVTG